MLFSRFYQYILLRLFKFFLKVEKPSLDIFNYFLKFLSVFQVIILKPSWLDIIDPSNFIQETLVVHPLILQLCIPKPIHLLPFHIDLQQVIQDFYTILLQHIKLVIHYFQVKIWQIQNHIILKSQHHSEAKYFLV